MSKNNKRKKEKILNLYALMKDELASQDLDLIKELLRDMLITFLDRFLVEVLKSESNPLVESYLEVLFAQEYRKKDFLSRLADVLLKIDLYPEQFQIKSKRTE